MVEARPNASGVSRCRVGGVVLVAGGGLGPPPKLNPASGGEVEADDSNGEAVVVVETRPNSSGGFQDPRRAAGLGGVCRPSPMEKIVISLTCHHNNLVGVNKFRVICP